MGLYQGHQDRMGLKPAAVTVQTRLVQMGTRSIGHRTKSQTYVDPRTMVLSFLQWMGNFAGLPVGVGPVATPMG